MWRGAEDLVDVLRLHERGEVQHHADPDAGADVGRAGGQVAEPLVEGVIQALFQLVIEAIDLLPDFREREPGAHHLDAEVVLLVDHDRGDLVAADGDPARAFGVHQFPADELTLDEELAVEGVEVLDVDIAQFDAGSVEGLADLALDVGFFAAIGAVDERVGRQVAGEPNP